MEAHLLAQRIARELNGAPTLESLTALSYVLGECLAQHEARTGIALLRDVMNATEHSMYRIKLGR